MRMGKKRKKRRDVREKEKDRELKKRKKERGQFAFELLTNPQYQELHRIYISVFCLPGLI